MVKEKIHINITIDKRLIERIERLNEDLNNRSKAIELALRRALVDENNSMPVMRGKIFVKKQQAGQNNGHKA